MNKLHRILLSGMAATAFCAPLAIADQNGVDSDTSHPGAYVKDSVITAKVKSKLAAKHLATLKDIKVDTDNQGVVWLSGIAPTKDASDLAVMIAKDTDGVAAVHNKISVAD